MRPANLLAQLALCASCAHAFYPYTPDWRRDQIEEKRTAEGRRSVEGQSDRGVRFGIKQRTPQIDRRPVSERAAREAARLSVKYAGRHLPSDTADGVVVKRENQFDIMRATESTRKFTAGLHQDGTDYSYFVEAELGSKGKSMYMLIDTGAGSSWVMGSSCKTEACSMHNTFGPDDSDTLEVTGRDFSIAYGSGKVNGKLARDTIGVAGMSFKYQFGLSTNTSDEFVQFAFDGILGLAMNTGANENFMNALEAAGEIDKNVFCVALNRASDGTNEGEISFGSPNREKYTGKITYSAVTGEEHDWAIEIDDMGYKGKTAGVGGLRTYIDTGTSFMFGPPDAVKKVHSLIPDAKSTDDVTFTVPCDTDGHLTFTFSGVDYEVSPKDWVSPRNKDGRCTSNLYGHEVVEGAWLLGDTFIKNVYAVFDADERRIGFANNAITDGAERDTSDKTKTKDSDKASKTSSPTSEGGDKTRVTALPDTTGDGKPDIGLGHESVQRGTATQDESQPTETKDSSSAPIGPLSQARYTFLFCIVPFFALLA